jgi:hypothetical protein
MTERSRGVLDLIASALPFVWIGLVMGVSFIATPAKFQAENLDGALALAISMVTFLWLHVAEGIMAALMVLMLILTRARWVSWALLGVAVVSLVLQADWILPAFEARAGFIPILPTLDYHQLHSAFALSEGTKIIALIGLGTSLFLRTARAPSN